MTSFDARHLAEPKGRLDFETLISDLSAQFVHVRGEEVDRCIQESLERILTFFGVERCGLLRVQHDRKFVYVSHAAYAPGAQHVPREWNLADLFPWLYHRLVERGENAVVRRLSELPAEGQMDQQTFSGMGVQAALHVPLRVAGAIRYIMALNSTRGEVSWPEQYLPRLRLLGENFVNALERQRSELLVAESEAKLRLAAESASMGLWSLDLETGRLWVTDKIREFFGYAPDDEVTLEGVLQQVRPEDRGNVRQALEDALREQTEGRVEYRVASPDGSVRWLASRGRPQKAPFGGTHRVMGVTMDITERKRAETELRENTERMAAAVDVARLGCYEARWDQQRIVLEDRIRDLVGVPPEEEHRVLDYWLERVHPEDRDRVLEVRHTLLTGGNDPLTVEYRYQHPKKGELWFHHSVRALDFDPQGQVARSLGVIHDVTEQRRAEARLREALEETRRLKNELQQQNVYLSEQLKERADGGPVVGESEPVLRMLAEALRVAPTDAAVLITGETGAGKELLARAIHEMSRRCARPMITVSCAALPATLIESELFGRERGAYTGAVTQQIGRFELANGSTLFLDEIAELPPDLQSKLLRVLQEGQFERLGSHRTRTADVRVIAATNRDLRSLVKQGGFRPDLFYRLSVFPIHVPPLRERRDDIPLLVWHFVRHFCKKMGKAIDSIPRRAMEELQTRPWPGNVRELRNTIERAVILSDGATLRVDPPAGDAPETPGPTKLDEVERRHILSVLQRTGWRISGRSGAAEQLGLIPTTLHSKLKKLGISRPKR